MQYPEVTSYIQEFISLQTDKLSAQNRRRDKLEYCGGFTLPELKEFIDERYQQDQNKLIKISTTSIHRLFSAPNKKFRNASSYKDLFGVKKFGGKFL